MVQKCQYYYTLLDQSIHLATVRSNVSLLTEQLDLILTIQVSVIPIMGAVCYLSAKYYLAFTHRLTNGSLDFFLFDLRNEKC